MMIDDEESFKKPVFENESKTQEVENDPVVKYHFSISQCNSKCFIMKYLHCGDLKTLLKQEGWLPELSAKYYCADLILCVESLHKQNLMHSSICPKNILIDDDGHLCFTDFGATAEGVDLYLNQSSIENKTKILEGKKKIFEKYIQQCLNKTIKEKNCNHELREQKKNSSPKLNSNMGYKSKCFKEMYYLAPEIINGSKKTCKSADYWAIAVITFEMITGLLPFLGETKEDLQSQIMNEPIKWSDFKIGSGDGHISQNAVDFLSQMLKKNENERLGYSNINELKDHPFFSGIDFSKFRKQKLPFISKASGIYSEHQLNINNEHMQNEDASQEISSQYPELRRKSVKTKQVFSKEAFKQTPITPN